MAFMKLADLSRFKTPVPKKKSKDVIAPGLQASATAKPKPAMLNAPKGYAAPTGKGAVSTALPTVPKDKNRGKRLAQRAVAQLRGR